VNFYCISRWVLVVGLALSLPLKAQITWQPKADIASAFLLSVNGQMLWQKSVNQRLPPASLTKLLTALIIIENPKLHAWVKVSQNASLQDGTKINAKQGEAFQAAYLLGAMLMKSANDACMALVEWDAGTEAAFIKKMEAKVKQLDLQNTHFTNPCGFDDAKHFSSANDLLKIAQLANAQTKIKVWTEMVNYTLLSKSKKAYPLTNSNMLLGRIAGVDGLKTGYTQKAGKCLIAHGKNDKNEVYLVLLNAPDRWWSADEMMNRALASNE
jgi:serine-type D-Ala-D-Ala carboxypeptidase (penicillin-binding protein 5/6)